MTAVCCEYGDLDFLTSRYDGRQCKDALNGGFVMKDRRKTGKTRGQNVYSNLYSQAVTHPSTNRSQPCLTSVIGRELVYSR